VISEKLVIPADNRILYFTRDREIFRFLSHFHPAPIVLDGETWPTVEHYYQAQKSAEPAYRQ
jgi:N-glycosidase YbiA